MQFLSSSRALAVMLRRACDGAQGYATVVVCSPRSSRPSALRIVAVIVSPGLR